MKAKEKLLVFSVFIVVFSLFQFQMQPRHAIAGQIPAQNLPSCGDLVAQIGGDPNYNYCRYLPQTCDPLTEYNLGDTSDCDYCCAPINSEPSPSLDPCTINGDPNGGPNPYERYECQAGQTGVIGGTFNCINNVNNLVLGSRSCDSNQNEICQGPTYGSWPCTKQSSGGTINIEVRQAVGQGSTDPPTGTYTYNIGDSITFTANPDSGWSFVKWQGSGGESTLQSLTLTLTTSGWIQAVFTENGGATISGSCSQATGQYTQGFLTPDSLYALTGQTVTFSTDEWPVKCANQPFSVRIANNGNYCTGDILCTGVLGSDGSGSCNYVVNAPPDTYTINSCVDKNNNGIVTDFSEQSFASTLSICSATNGNNPFAKGTCQDQSGATFTDSCSGLSPADTLIKYYCSKNSCVSNSLSCAAQCANGGGGTCQTGACICNGASTTTATTPNPPVNTYDVIFIPINYNSLEVSRFQDKAMTYLNGFDKAAPASCAVPQSSVAFLMLGMCSCDVGTDVSNCLDIGQECANDQGYYADRYVLIVKSETLDCSYGCAPGSDAGSVVAVADNTLQSILVHEWGHYYGLEHVNANIKKENIDGVLVTCQPHPTPGSMNACDIPSSPNHNDCFVTPERNKYEDSMTYCSPANANSRYGPAAYSYLSKACLSAASSHASQRLINAQMTFYKNGTVNVNSIDTGYGFITPKTGDYQASTFYGNGQLSQTNFDVNYDQLEEAFYDNGSVYGKTTTLDKVTKTISIPYLPNVNEIQIQTPQNRTLYATLSRINQNTNQIVAIANQECHSNQNCTVQVIACSDNLNILINNEGNPLSSKILVDDKFEVTFTPVNSGKVRMINFCFSPTTQVTVNTIEVS